MNAPSLSPQKMNWNQRTSEVASALQALFADDSWTHYGGRALDRLGEQIQQYTGCNSLLCSSGSIAVELALRACRVEEGDEVILSAYDYPGNFRCIEAVKAQAVVIDVQPASWSMDLNQLQEAISTRTKAVIVSHLHGEIQDLTAIRSITESQGIKLIEDACQGVGGRCGERALGSWGDVGVWSFGGSKLLTAGRGGGLLTNDPALMQRARVASQRSNDAMALSQLQAAALVPQMERLETDTAYRFEGARVMIEALAKVDWCRCSSRPLAPTEVPGYYKLGVQVSGGREIRDALVQQASARGAEVGAGFRGFANRSSQRCRRIGDLSQAGQVGARTLVIHHRHLHGAPDEIRWFVDQLSTIAAELPST